MVKLVALRLLVQLGAVAVGRAAGISDVTGLSIFSSLAPCAASALSYVVESLTEASCPADVTALQSCACSKDNNSAAIATRLASSVLSYFCTKTATEDVSSVAVVFNYYCNQGATATPVFSNAASPVSQYITDLPAFAALVPCAASGVSYAVQRLTESYCPSDAADLVSCACTKDQNSAAVSDAIGSSVIYTCGSTHADDLSSAQAVFAGYCGLGSGVSSFATASALPAQMTYYITDLPNFTSLAPCAASAVSYAIFSQTYYYCNPDPAGLVSCVCMKDKNSASVSSLLSSEIKYMCGSTASADVTSGLGLFDYYCSAAEGLVTPAGITNSVPATVYGSGVTATAAATGAGARPTNPKKTAPVNSLANTGSFAGSTSPAASNNSSSSSNIGLIAGVAGGVAGGIALVLVAWAIWCCRRRRRRMRQQEPQPDLGHGPGPGPVPVDEKASFLGGKAELDNSTILTDLPPKGDGLAPSPTPVSAVSPNSIYAVPAVGQPSELYSPQDSIQSSEVLKHGGLATAGMNAQQNASEMYGQGMALPMHGSGPLQHRHEMAGQRDLSEMHRQGVMMLPHEMAAGSAQGTQQVYEMSPTGSHVSSAAYNPYPQGYAPLPGQNHTSGLYEMPSQRWE